MNLIKRAILLLIFLALPCQAQEKSPVFIGGKEKAQEPVQVARLIPEVLGASGVEGGGAPSCEACNTTNDSEFYNTGNVGDTYTNTSSWVGFPTTVTSTLCCTGVMWPIADNNQNRGTTVEIWTDVDGSPGAIVNAVCTATIANLANGTCAVDTYFEWASTYTLAPGTYWVVSINPDGVLYYCDDTVVPVYGEAKTSSDSGSSWSSWSGRNFDVSLMGCDPS